MGQRGPQPIRALQAVREGNPSHEPIRAVPKLPPAKPTEPKWVDLFPPVRAGAELVGLKGPERAKLKAEIARRNGESIRCRHVARESWRRWVRVLFAQGLISEVDAEALQDAAVCWAEIDRAVRDIARRGTWVESERGTSRNPSVTAAAQLRTAFKSHSQSLGLAPTYRVGLVAAWDVPGGNGEHDDDIFD